MTATHCLQEMLIEITWKFTLFCRCLSAGKVQFNKLILCLVTKPYQRLATVVWMKGFNLVKDSVFGIAVSLRKKKKSFPVWPNIWQSNEESSGSVPRSSVHCVRTDPGTVCEEVSDPKTAILWDSYELPITKHLNTQLCTKKASFTTHISCFKFHLCMCMPNLVQRAHMFLSGLIIDTCINTPIRNPPLSFEVFITLSFSCFDHVSVW